MGFLLDTNILLELVRHPHGQIADCIARVGEQHVCTSIIVVAELRYVVAELRYGAAKKASSRLIAQLEAVLGAVEVLPLESPVDTIYGEERARLERAGHLISANDLLIGAQALALGHTLVTDDEREFSRITDLRIENWLRRRFIALPAVRPNGPR
jgi:tRNA(fMet)-specific endonuclease VapC